MSDAEAAAPTPGHELLLGLAGWVDDDLLAIGRELVAVGEETGALELLVASLAAARAALPHPVRDRLVDAAERRIGTDLARLVPPGAPLKDRTAHAFAADGGAPDATARIVELVDGLTVVARSRARTALAWRLTPAGAAPGPLPHPVVLIVLDDPAHADVLAYQVGAALARAGITASVEAFVDGAALPPYQRAALAAARPSPAVAGDRPATTDVDGSSAGVPETDRTDVAPPTAVTVTGPHGRVHGGDDVARSAEADRSDPLSPGWTPPERSAEESGAHAAPAVSATAGTGPQVVVPVGDERTGDDRTDDRGSRTDGDGPPADRRDGDDRTDGDSPSADRRDGDGRTADRRDAEGRTADRNDTDNGTADRNDTDNGTADRRDADGRSADRRDGEPRDQPRTVEAAGSGSGELETSAGPSGSGAASVDDTLATAQGSAPAGSGPAAEGAQAPGIAPSAPPPVGAGGVDPARFDPARNAVDRNVHGGRRPEIAANPPGANGSAGPAADAGSDARPTAPPPNGRAAHTSDAQPAATPTPNGSPGRTTDARTDVPPTTTPPPNGRPGRTSDAQPDSRPTATGSAGVRPGPPTGPDPYAGANGHPSPRPAPRRNPRPAPQASEGPDPGTPTPGRPAAPSADGHSTAGVDHAGEQDWARQWSDGSWSTSATPPAGADQDIEPATSPTPTTPPLSRVPPSPARRSSGADRAASGPGGSPAGPSPDPRHRHRLDHPAPGPPEPAGRPSSEDVLDSRLTPNEQELLRRLQQELAAREGGSTDQSPPQRNGTAHPHEQD